MRDQLGITYYLKIDNIITLHFKFKKYYKPAI